MGALYYRVIFKSRLSSLHPRAAGAHLLSSSSLTLAPSEITRIGPLCPSAARAMTLASSSGVRTGSAADAKLLPSYRTLPKSGTPAATGTLTGATGSEAPSGDPRGASAATANGISNGADKKQYTKNNILTAWAHLSTSMGISELDLTLALGHHALRRLKGGINGGH